MPGPGSPYKRKRRLRQSAALGADLRLQQAPWFDDDLIFPAAPAGAQTYRVGDNTADNFSGTTDTSIYQTAPTSNFGTSVNLEVVAFEVNDSVHTLVKFDLAPVPAGTATTATLNLWLNNAGGSAETVNIRRLLVPWDEAQATWNDRVTGTAWGTAGAQSDGVDRVAAVSGTLTRGTTTGQYYVSSDLSADITFWRANPSQNYGWVLEIDSAPAFNFGIFTSSEGTDGNRPFISVTVGSAGGTSLPVGLSAESDQAIASGLALRIGVAQESDFALARTAAQARAVGLSSEQDAALALTANQSRPVGLSTEQDTALALSQGGTSLPVGLATESDVALPLAAAQARGVGLSAETDTALARGISLGIAPATEADTALARPATQSRAVGVSTETDAALGLAANQARAVGLATEIDTAFALSQPGTVLLPVGLATEIDTALALGIIVANPVFTQVFTGGGGQAFPDRQPRKEPKPRKVLVGRKLEIKAKAEQPALPVVLPVGLAIEADEALPLQALYTVNGLMRTRMAPRLMRTSM